ncbi:hypothetical protein [Arsukibacterium sp. MJ3]|uniref:hypothetical protein n=1 Tax=Arsukibacterium sp. MJ3 TaxID=1632859 RepID=UPI00069C2239|nr:hypothetical protein [Arsukibacterium sp. MJ3]
MRWLSRFAILVYFSLLCSLQALAVQDSRIAPLGDSQLQALTPALHHYTLVTANDNDDPPPAVLITDNNNNCRHIAPEKLTSIAGKFATVCLRVLQPRAPPVPSSLLHSL